MQISRQCCTCICLFEARHREGNYSQISFSYASASRTCLSGNLPCSHNESRLLIHLLNSTAHLKVNPKANKSRFGSMCSNCKRSLRIIRFEATLSYKAKEGKKAEKLVGVGARENMWDTERPDSRQKICDLGP